MASSFTTNLRIEKPADGEKDGTWGQVINANITEMFEDAISAETSISTTGGTTVLTTNNGTADTSRNVFLDVSGTLVSNSTISIPSLNKFYLVRNGTGGSFTVTIKPSGTGAVVVQGETAIVYCDGTDCFEIGMGGFTITAFSKTLLDDTTAGAWMTTLGITSYMQTLLDDANEATLHATMNLEIGTDVQAWDTQLDDIAALAVTDGNFQVGDGSNWVAESGVTLRTSIGVDYATQAEQETGTATDKVIAPGTQQHHASAAKVWGFVDRSAGTPSLSSPSLNISGVTDDGSANTIVSIGTDFSTAIYAVGANGVDINRVASPNTLTVGAFDVFINDTQSTDLDTASFTCWAFGDQ